jgi:hypothetical protein
MQGMKESKGALEKTCNAQVTNGNLLLNPCGLIANSFFTDIITLSTKNSTPSTVSIDSSNIAWSSDSQKFKQPDGFQSVKVSSTTTAANCAANGLNDGCKLYKDPNTQQYYLYYYPDDANTQYLYETYPDQISPINGVTDQHFKVWMRPAPLPNFRKLFGKISGNFKKGNNIEFNVVTNFDVSDFDGSKSLIISTLGEFGGKNPNLGVAYIVVGIIAFVFGSLFASKQLFSPRPVADPALLNWN